MSLEIGVTGNATATGIESMREQGGANLVKAIRKGVGDAGIATGGSAGVEKDTVLPTGQRGVQKGASGSGGKLLRGDTGTKVIEGARFRNPIETDAVGTTGCKVTVSRPMAGRPAHAGNCQCFTCKPPKEK